jgi:pyridoxine 5-phosphate synthase
MCNDRRSARAWLQVRRGALPMIRLSVNLNKIALLRNSRGGNRPDVLAAAETCVASGCHGITVHPRPDERHTRAADVRELARMLTVEFNIEGYPSPEWLDLVCEVRPAQATLVPDEPGQLTSDHGWDLKSGRCAWLPAVVKRLKSLGIRTSLFLDADVEQVALAGAVGADRIELYTQHYAETYGTPGAAQVLAGSVAAAHRAGELGLGLNAGHDLNLQNLRHFARSIPGLLEVSIGHALICDALERGLAATVRAYVDQLA